MTKLAKRVALLGFDSAEPHLIDQHIAEGILPNFKAFKENSAWAADCLCPFPTITPPNWASMSTGAHPGTHGVTDFHGRALTDDPHVYTQNWSSRHLQVETIWEAADKAGKRCIVMNYPGAWPSKMKNGVVVASRGFTVGEAFRDGMEHLKSVFDFYTDFVVTTDFGAATARVKLQDATGWSNVDKKGDDPLEATFSPLAQHAATPIHIPVWHLLLRNLNGDAYDTISVSPSKDLKDAFFTITVGEWTQKIVLPFSIKAGGTNNGMFRCKFLKAGDGDTGEGFRLLMGSCVNMDQQWTDPAEYTPLLFKGKHCMHANGGSLLYTFKAVDADTYIEMSRESSLWLAEAAKAMLDNGKWDLFYVHSHPIDWQYHANISDMMSDDPKVRENGWYVHRGIVKNEDELLGNLLKLVDDGQTAIAIASDHGSVPDGIPFDPRVPLTNAGLMKMSGKSAKAEGAGDLEDDFVKKLAQGRDLDEIPDYSATKAIPARVCHIYVNLKGRDPHGIVDPKDYAEVQEAICDAMLTYVDPVSKKRPVILALPVQDARWLGLYGETCGDVIYATKPEFGSQHGSILPTSEFWPGKLNALMAFKGPGIKKGHVIKKPTQLLSLVPTFCYLTGFPVPDGCEAPVLYPAMEDPNAPFK